MTRKSCLPSFEKQLNSLPDCNSKKSCIFWLLGTNTVVFKSISRFLTSDAFYECPVTTDIAADRRSLLDSDLIFCAAFHGWSASGRQICFCFNRSNHGDRLAGPPVSFAACCLAFDCRSVVIFSCLLPCSVSGISTFTGMDDDIGSVDNRPFVIMVSRRAV